MLVSHKKFGATTKGLNTTCTIRHSNNDNCDNFVHGVPEGGDCQWMNKCIYLLLAEPSTDDMPPLEGEDEDDASRMEEVD